MDLGTLSAAQGRRVVVGGGGGALDGGAVTLLSYARPEDQQGSGGRARIFQKGGSSSSSSSSSVAKVFKTLRRRSKSASRLKDQEKRQQQGRQQQDQDDFRGSDCSLNQLDNRYRVLDDDPVRPITYTCNGERLSRDPDSARKPDRVTLIGFTSPGVQSTSAESGWRDQEVTRRYRPSGTAASRQVSGRNRLRRRSNYDFGGSAHNLSYSGGDGNSGGGNFATLKTSREVKMERERLRQERLREQQQQRRKGLLLESPSSSSTRLTMLDTLMAEERARFFEEAREEFARRNLASSELFSQFVRENQERFQQLVQHRR